MCIRFQLVLFLTVTNPSSSHKMEEITGQSMENYALELHRDANEDTEDINQHINIVAKTLLNLMSMSSRFV